MQLTNKIWLGFLAAVVITDIIIIIAIGAKGTLSYFVWSHREIPIIPFTSGAAMGHFWNKRFNPIYKLIGNYKYLVLGLLASLVLIISIAGARCNPNFLFFPGYGIGWLFWGQVKIK